MDVSSYAGGALTAKADCSDSKFEQVDPAKLPTLATSDDATEAWYAGKKYYDFKTGGYQAKYNNQVLTAQQKLDADAFTRMVWKKTTTVAFGIRDRWVYARYCLVQGNTGGPAAYLTNVK